MQALLLQNVLLLALVYHHQRRSVGRTLVMVATLSGWAVLFSSGALTRSHITALYDVNNMLLVASRVPQILQNHASSSTGQLSIITYSLNTAGSAARIFTSIHEKAGAAMLRGATLSEYRPRAVRAALMSVWGRPSDRVLQGGASLWTRGAAHSLTVRSPAAPAGALLNAVMVGQIVAYRGGDKSKRE